MQTFGINPLNLVKGLKRNHALLISLTRREIDSRYRGTMAGTLWALFQPLLMLSIYTFVFSVIFKARWGQNETSDAEYSLILFIGLFVFQVFSECVNRAPTLVVGNVNYVKKIIFPLETLPLIAMGGALFQLFISLGVWVVARFILMGPPPLTGLMFPFILMPLLFFTLGLSWLLASLGVFVRDVAQLTAIVTTVLFFMSPIFYPVTAVPERFQFFYKLNPITYVVEQSREVLFFGQYPDVLQWSIYMASSLLVAWLGYSWFQATRRGFADVL